MNQDRTKRKLTAILSADVVGYSRLMEEDEAWTIKTLEENKKLISEFIEEYKGRVVDAPGDNILAEFSSVTNAVECAVEIQKELKVKNANLVEDRRMEFRIGVNLGEVVEEDGRIYGSGVNIAARLEGLTEAGGICISRRAYDHVKTQLDLSYEYMGEQCVKNISEPIRVYRVLMDSKTAGKVIGEKRFLGRMSRRMALASIIILIIIAAGSICWNIYSHRLTKEEIPKTIAVLPFDDRSPERDRKDFVDGLSEEIGNTLTRLGLRVIGRTSSNKAKEDYKDYKEMGDVLGATHILEGSVRKSDDLLRVTPKLINVSDGIQIWTDNYDCTMDTTEDIFTIYDDIAKSVADALQIKLGEGELGRAPGMTNNIAAYEAFLAGRSLKLQFGPENILKSIDQLEQAVALDSNFTIGWRVLADAYSQAATILFPERARDFSVKRKKALSKVVELAPETDFALLITASQSGDWVEVERLLKKALKVAPANYDTNYEYAWFLNKMGRPTEAIDYIQRLLRLEPLASGPHLGLGVSYELRRNNDAAVMAIEKAKELTNDDAFYNATLLVLAMEEKNRDLINEFLISGNYLEKRDFNQVMNTLLDTPEEAGAELRLLLTDPAYSSPIYHHWISIWASYFGEFELALNVNKEVIGSDSTLIWTIWRPINKGIRQLPEFKDFVREIGLVDYWRKTGNWGEFCRPVGDDDFVCE